MNRSFQVRSAKGEPGIAPFAVFGGALQMRDGIEVDFRVVGRNSGGAVW